MKSEHALEQARRRHAAQEAALRLPHNASGMTSDIVASRGGGNRSAPNNAKQNATGSFSPQRHASGDYNVSNNSGRLVPSPLPSGGFFSIPSQHQRRSSSRFVPQADRTISGLSPVPVESRRQSAAFNPVVAVTVATTSPDRSRSSSMINPLTPTLNNDHPPMRTEEVKTVWASPRRTAQGLGALEPTRDSWIEAAVRDLSPPRPVTHEIGIDPIDELRAQDRNRSEELQRSAEAEAAEIEARRRALREERERQLAEEERLWLQSLKERQMRREAIAEAEKAEERIEQERREASRKQETEAEEAKRQARLDYLLKADRSQSLDATRGAPSPAVLPPLPDRNSAGRLGELKAQFDALRNKTSRPFAKSTPQS